MVRKVNLMVMARKGNPISVRLDLISIRLVVAALPICLVMWCGSWGYLPIDPHILEVVKGSFVRRGVLTICRLLGFDMPVFIIILVSSILMGTGLGMVNPAGGAPAANPAAPQIIVVEEFFLEPDPLDEATRWEELQGKVAFYNIVQDKHFTEWEAQSLVGKMHFLEGKVHEQLRADGWSNDKILFLKEDIRSAIFFDQEDRLLSHSKHEGFIYEISRKGGVARCGFYEKAKECGFMYDVELLEQRIKDELRRTGNQR
jgi:hypothetical protein